MKTLLTIFLATLCAATSYGQTMKALSYNTTNGVVAYSGTNKLTFTNEVRFGGGDLRIDSAGGIYWSGDVRYEPETQTFYEQIQFDSPATAATTRTNLGIPLAALTNNNVTNFRSAIGLGLPALTNTSNVTTMRALAGSTNTNQPYSGVITYKDDADEINTLTVSNGIIIQLN
jgi:hypothetical protein